MSSFNWNQNWGKNLYIMVGGDGQPVAGTDIWRKKMPSKGRWKKVDIDTCCTGSVLTYTPPDVTLTDGTLAIKCDGTTKASAIITGVSTDIDSLVALLNSKGGFLGAFDVEGEDITMRVKASVSSGIACTGTLSFTVT